MTILALALALQVSTAPAAAGVPSLVQPPKPMLGDPAPFMPANPVSGNATPETFADAGFRRAEDLPAPGPAPRSGERLNARPGGSATAHISTDPRNVLEDRQNAFDRR